MRTKVLQIINSQIRILQWLRTDILLSDHSEFQSQIRVPESTSKPWFRRDLLDQNAGLEETQADDGL